MAWKTVPIDLIIIFDRVAPTHPPVERRKMFGCPCLFVHGNMFAGLFGDKMWLRLPDGTRERFLRMEGGGSFEPVPGKVMTEYVTVSGQLLGHEAALRRWLDRSLEYALSLPPKETKRAAPAREAAATKKQTRKAAAGTKKSGRKAAAGTKKPGRKAAAGTKKSARKPAAGAKESARKATASIRAGHETRARKKPTRKLAARKQAADKTAAKTKPMRETAAKSKPARKTAARRRNSGTRR